MFQTLPGFREFYPPDCAARNYIFHRFRQITKRFGFEEYDAPLLEPLELFTLKSGEEIVAQLFNFADRGGRLVALRPEMTPSLARMIGARAASLKRPIRWCNIGENFRYERPQKGRLRSFYQMNADLLGSQNVAADGEMISLLIDLLRSFGLSAKDFQIRLSDRKLWVFHLQNLGISEPQIPAVLQIIDKMEREPAEITAQKLQQIDSACSNDILLGISELGNCHSLEELKTFFKSKKNAAIEARLNDWESLLARLSASGADKYIRIDFCIVRGLAYYTGFVFEAFECGSQARALAGGGRYDDLVKKLTAIDVPAVGFALGDVTLGNLLKEKNLLPTYAAAPQIVMIFEPATQERALSLCQQLRREQISVIFDLNESTSFSKQLRTADKCDATYALLLGQDELNNGLLTLKNLQLGTSKQLSLAELLSHFGVKSSDANSR